ncbi:hypothetical protein DY000_02063226 [Brassica cretica]|uniref:Remorin C-terminal domain-containing protein n=1 Tax=Brassica cretica TaxID=69181 RepID=A0ABQ7AUB3_BRACR|nr:hypothetical protein DY000_02063226 [Brassica cretica]
MKARAEEKLANKLAATKRIAEERRANAEAKLNEKAVRTSERADYIRRSGHLPSSFSFKIPSFSLCGSVWRKESIINPTAVIRSVCVRDMGTEMTPIGSQEPSRTGTPVRATTPVGRSPVTSPVRASHGVEAVRTETVVTEGRSVASDNNEKISFGDNNNDNKGMNAMEARAMAWDEAERAKFMAR